MTSFKVFIFHISEYPAEFPAFLPSNLSSIATQIGNVTLTEITFGRHPSDFHRPPLPGDSVLAWRRRVLLSLLLKVMTIDHPLPLAYVRQWFCMSGLMWTQMHENVFLYFIMSNLTIYEQPSNHLADFWNNIASLWTEDSSWQLSFKKKYF